MKPLIRHFTQEAAAPLEDMLARLIRSAALIAMGVGCAIAASVFLTIDLYLYVEHLKGPLIAAASIAGAYLLAAPIFLWLGMRRPSRSPPRELDFESAATAPLTAASVGAQAAPRSAELATNIDRAVAPVLNVLRDAGLQREVLSIEAGTEVAKQLSPFSLVAFAAGAGIVIGRALRDRR
jgi:hypothetical protein